MSENVVEKEFCLVDERWIRVIDNNCKITEVSLLELFENAHKYKGLCGELPTQDIAVLRVLLAILLTVFSRYDLSGNKSPFNDPDDALERWQDLWNNGEFPIEVIKDYLNSQRDSFYLFHPDRPFYQCENAEIGTEYTAAKLYGNLSESGNKTRIFPIISGNEKKKMSFQEAARWLININAYDDASAKVSSDNKERAEKEGIMLYTLKVGWLGQLGLITVMGNNLFETLMYNLTFLNENGDLYEETEKPIWERETIPSGESVKISWPKNLSELYTFQFRRLLLIKENKQVVGEYVLNGKFFDNANFFLEPMTIWTNPKKGRSNIITPKKHDSSKQLWREFSSIAIDEDNHKPGVITWIERLVDAEILDDRILSYKISSVEYDGGHSSSVINVFSDSLQMHASLISNAGDKMKQMVVDNVEFSETVSKKVWNFAKDVNLAQGGDFIPKESNCSAKVFAERAKADFYNLIDTPFRKWLYNLNPLVDNTSEKETEWREECTKIALNLGKDIIKGIPHTAIFGKVEKTDNKTIVYSVAKAMNRFVASIKNIEKK